jgi:hypothetical protein
MIFWDRITCKADRSKHEKSRGQSDNGCLLSCRKSAYLLLFTRTVQTVTGAPILEVDFVEMGALWLILHVGCRLISGVMSRL